jgi:hypothetical protein
MIGIIEINIERIVKDGFGVVKGNAMLSEVCRGLRFILLKSHRLYLSTVLRAAGV